MPEEHEQIPVELLEELKGVDLDDLIADVLSCDKPAVLHIFGFVLVANEPYAKMMEGQRSEIEGKSLLQSCPMKCRCKSSCRETKAKAIAKRLTENYSACMRTLKGNNVVVRTTKIGYPAGGATSVRFVALERDLGKAA